MIQRIQYCLLLTFVGLSLCLFLLMRLGTQSIQAQPLASDSGSFSIEITTTLPSIDKGQLIPLEITLHNQSLSALENVTATVMLNGIPIDGCGLDTPTQLAPGNLRGYTCTTAGSDRDIEIQAVAQGTDINNNLVQATNQFFIDIIAPQIAIDLSVDNAMTLLNHPITYSVAVTNNGDFRLNYVGVIDTQIPDCALEEIQSRVLEIGEMLRYTCVMTRVTADFTHTIRAEASPPIGRFVFDEEQLFIDVITPALTIEKTPPFQTVDRDTTASFVLKVTNVGDVPLTHIVVSDSHSSGCAYSTSTPLNPGEFIGYSCSQSIANLDLQTHAVVQAMTPISTLLMAQADAAVDVLTPFIDIKRTPADLLLSVGENAQFSVTVTNSSNADLADIALYDPSIPDCTRILDNLKQGESQVYRCEQTNVTASLTSTLLATATSVTAPWQGEVVTQQIQTHIHAAILATIGDLVWEDRNYNGIQDEGEPGIADVELQLYSAGGQDAQPLYTTTSDNQGHYQFDKLFAGDYRIQIVLPPDSAITLNGQATDIKLDNDVDAVTGQTALFRVTEGVDQTDLDIGLYYPAQLGGHIWYDSDLDGVSDDDEKGVSGVTVTLYQDERPIAEMETDRDGNYLFENLVPAVYYTKINAPNANFRFSVASGDNSVTGSSPTLLLRSGDDISQINTGLYELALVSGQIWNATDYDGIRGADEEPSSDVVARLYTMPNRKLVDVQAVNEIGRYTFSRITPGNYYVHFQQPADAFWGSPIGQGNDASLNNDVSDNGQSASFQITATTDLRTLDGALHRLPEPSVDLILNLRATPMQDAIVITWLAVTDPLTRGYHLWRGQVGSENDVALRLTKNEMQISLVGVAAQYDLLDVTAQPDVTYIYWVEVMGLDGSRQNSVPLHSALDRASPLRLWQTWMPILMR